MTTNTEFLISNGWITKKQTKEQLISSLIEEYWEGYLECLFWQATDEYKGKTVNIDDYINNYEPENDDLPDSPITLSVLKVAYKSLKTFLTYVIDNYPLMLDFFISPHEYTCSETIGHDLCLTQNGHGAGFWDGDYNDECHELNIGKTLSKCCACLKNAHVLIGDNGLLYGAYC